MLQNTSLVLLTICINYISTEYTISSDGWIPVARDKVFNQMNREWAHNFIHLTKKPKFDSNDVLKILDTKQNTANGVKNKESRDILDPVKQNYVAEKILQNQVHKNDKAIIDETESPRKAKKIFDLSLENIIDIDNTNVKKKEDALAENSDTGIIDIVDRSNTYEVTEAMELNHSEESTGYDYTPPTTEKQNFSSALINILSKYNIKTDDKLQNYDLSRQTKTQNRLPNIHTLWNPFSYNSQNHLSVDPLLAVFLSNYGFYLPSLYGIKSNYNNLYGYLASNNIHNNKPFGMYKVFSDTDSYN